MLQRLARDLKLSLPHSFVVGDKLSDIELGKNVGATTFLVLTGCGRATVDEAREAAVEPDFVVPSLVEAVDHIMEIIGGLPVHHD